MNITDELEKLVIRLQRENLPSEVVNAIKYDVIDFLGVSFAGAKSLNNKLTCFLELSNNCGSSKSIGLGRFTNVEQAALINGLSSHYLEMDDGNRFGMVHPGSVVLSSLFAVAKSKKIASKDFIQGVFVGYEIAIRLASAIQPGHKKRGFHATGTCGVIAASMAVATALSIDTKYIKNIISVATASACGLLEMIDDCSELKPFNIGIAAKNGINAVYLGASGFAGPNDCIGGKRGLLGVMAESFDLSWLDFDKHSKYTILTAYKKPYASCRHCHSPIEAILNINKKYNFKLSSIVSVKVETYDMAIYGHDKKDIKNPTAAKMSIPYSVASALVFNNGGISSYNEESITNINISSLLGKITIVENPVFSKLVPEKRIARVSILLKDGTNLEETIEYPRGEPENPLTKKEIEEKYFQMMEYAQIDKTSSNQILNCVIDLENRLDDLICLL